MLGKTRTKFGLNQLKHCKDKAINTLDKCQFCCVNFVKFVNTLHANGLVYQKAFDNFLPELSEDDLPILVKIGRTILDENSKL